MARNRHSKPARTAAVVNPVVDNPMFAAARAAMTPEQIEEYKAMGEQMYNNINFSTSEVEGLMGDPLADSIAYITELLKSGLSPNELSESEMLMMENAYGSTWSKRFGYQKSADGSFELA